jgi:hypothetical protein
MTHLASCRTGANAVNAIAVNDEVGLDQVADPALARPIAVTTMKRGVITDDE